MFDGYVFLGSFGALFAMCLFFVVSGKLLMWWEVVIKKLAVGGSF